MKLGILHFAFKPDGITRVVRGNAIALHAMGVEVVAIGDAQPHLPDFVAAHGIDWEDVESIPAQLEAACKMHALDALLIENPTLGTKPECSLQIQKFVERTQVPIFYRCHDLLHKRRKFGEYEEGYLAAGGSVANMYPENAHICVLTNEDKVLLENPAEANLQGRDIRVMPNPILLSEFEGCAEKGREAFAKVTDSAAPVMLYPVRLIERKNVEEALLLLRGLQLLGHDYQLVTTLAAKKHHNAYVAAVVQLAEDFNLPASLGALGQYINGTTYSVADIAAAADVCITTAMNEGFGYTFLEPQLCGTPVIGRRLNNAVEDFEKDGVNFNYLYTEAELPFAGTWEARIANARALLENEAELKALMQRLDMPARIAAARKAQPANAKNIAAAYSHTTVTKQLLQWIESKL